MFWNLWWVPGLCVPKSLLSEPSPDSILLTNANPNHGIIIISFRWIKKWNVRWNCWVSQHTMNVFRSIWISIATTRFMLSKAHLALSRNNFVFVRKDHLGSHFYTLVIWLMSHGHGLVDKFVSFWACSHFKDMVTFGKPHCWAPQPWHICKV